MKLLRALILFIVLIIAAFVPSACNSPLFQTRLNISLVHELETDASNAEIEKDLWYSHYINGQKIGWENIRKANFFKYGEVFNLRENKKYYRMSRGKDINEEWSTLRIVSDRMDVFKYFVMVEKGSNEETTYYLAKADNRTIQFTAVRGETRTNRKLSQTDPMIFPVKESFQLLQYRPGYKMSKRLVSIDNFKAVINEYEVLGQKRIRVSDSEINTWHVLKTVRYGDQLAEVEEFFITNDDKRSVVKKITNNGLITVVLTTERLAKSNLDTVRLNEIFDIQLKEPVRNPHKITQARILIHNDKLNQLIIQDQWQLKHADKAIGQTEWVFYARKMSAPVSAKFPLKSPEKVYLRPNFYIQSDNSKIKQKALSIVGAETNAHAALKKITMWVYRNITKKNYAIGMASALETLEKLEGDCTEHAFLAVALARAIGIPSRVACGLTSDGKSFAYHMWIEGLVAPNVWAAMDPAFGQVEPDALHIKFYQGDINLDNRHDLEKKYLGLTGNVEIDILHAK